MFYVDSNLVLVRKKIGILINKNYSALKVLFHNDFSDLKQDLFLHVLTKANLYSKDVSPVSWLVKVLENKIKDILGIVRRRKKILSYIYNKIKELSKRFLLCDSIFLYIDYNFFYLPRVKLKQFTDYRITGAFTKEVEHKKVVFFKELTSGLFVDKKILKCLEGTFLRKLGITHNELFIFCKFFKIKIKDGNFKKAFEELLDYTLNKLSDEGFNRIPPFLRNRLIAYGEQYQKNTLIVNKNGELRSKGLTKVVRTCIERGYKTNKEVRSYFDKLGIIYNNYSIRSILHRELKKVNNNVIS